ncbi:MAG: PH domain-containing protein [Alphaproteobacteria bacterium]|nr:PH domain-containing protein [Alphaproteobacteria bacterium]
MRNEDILSGMLSNEEGFLWQVTGSIADWKYNPLFLLLTVLTFGLFLIGLHYYRTYNYYVLTTTRLIIISGILGRKVDEIELFRVIDSSVNQSFVDRCVHLGDINVISTDKTGAVVMRKIEDPYRVRDALRAAYREARSQRGTVVLEQS